MSLRQAFALLLLWPGLVLAQADVPLIPLAPMAAPAAPAPPVAPPVGGAESPLIDLAPMAPDAGALPEATAGPATPLPRDDGGATAPVTATMAGWLLPLVPAAANVPKEVRIGGSLPEPGQFRLTGETASAEFLLTLPEGVAPPEALRLSLRSGVNVLPDTSVLVVRVNGTEAGRVTLANIGDFAEQLVPVTGLTPGANRITLTATQPHRIFCGPEASFAVWTEVDLGHSGVLVDPGLLPLNPQGFTAAMQSEIAQGGAIQILVEDSTDAALVRAVARRLADTFGGQSRIEVLPFYTVQSGREARARVALIASAQAMATVRRGAGGAVVLQIEHQAGTLPDLDGVLPLQTGTWGIPLLTPGRVTTLAELGGADVLANTHYFRQDLNFLLPEDWLLLASQKAEFVIHYGFSADLAEGALLLFKVNGQTVRLLPLDREGGKVQPPLDISFRANRLNPGVNTLTFEMTVPGDPPDLPCTPRQSDMLVILADSSLSVPPSPHMRQTDMSRSLARLGGEDVIIPAEVADPARDAPTLLAFGALLHPLVEDGTDARLRIVGLDAVGLVPTGDTGVTRRMLQNAVYPALELTPATPATPAPAAAGQAFSLADADGAVVATTAAAPEDRPSLWDEAARFFSTDGWLSAQFGGVRDVAFPGNVKLSTWLADKSGQAMLLQLDPDTPDDIWLIAGPDIAMPVLARAVDDFRRTGRSEVHGQVALLQQDGRWLTWSQNRRPELLEPLTPQNLRTVLGNYASWSPLVFTVLTLVLALLSVIPALFFVLMTRRSGSRT